VTCFLSPSGSDTTLSSIRELAAGGSVLAFDYLTRAMAEGNDEYHGAKIMREAVAALGEPFSFGIDDDGLADLLAERGFTLEAMLLPEQIEGRNLVGSDGQVSGRILGFMRFALARV